VGFQVWAKLGLSIFSTLSLAGSAWAQGDSTFQCGANLFKGAQYSIALNYFAAAQKETPYDVRPFYYEALCRQRLGQLHAAQNCFHNIIVKFPDSEAAEFSKVALAGMGASYSASKGGGSLLGKVRTDVVPELVKTTGKEVEGKVQLTITLNGKPVKVLADKTANDTIIGEDVLKESGIIPMQSFNLEGKGGKKEPAKGAYALYDLRLDGIEKNGFVVFVSKEEPKKAILGSDFFNYISLEFDKKTGNVTLKRDLRYRNAFAEAMKLIDKGRYREALPLLKKATADNARDPRVLYTYAVCLQKTNNLEAAKVTFRKVVKRFPGTEAAFLAHAFLNAADPQYVRELAEARKVKEAVVPGGTNVKAGEFEIPYYPENGRIRVSALVDGKTVEMWFEKFQTDCIFGKNQISDIDPYYLTENTPVVSAPDQNTQEVSSTWTFKLKRIKFGQIDKVDFPCRVQDFYRLPYSGNNWGPTERPILPHSIAAGYRMEFLDNKRVIKFIKLTPGDSQLR
jgi:tetratricopeptide (TPR) repeat protein